LPMVWYQSHQGADAIGNDMDGNNRF
jgi:hypothetical protein